MAQCTFKTDKGRQCKLDAHDDSTKHKFAIRKEQVPLSKLVPAGFALKAERVPDGERIRKQTASTAAAHTEADQKRVDSEAVIAYREWVKAGKPTDFTKHPLSRYIVPPRAVDAVLTLLRRAVGVGGPAEIRGKSFRYRKGTHTTGNTVIQWSISDPIEKTETK